MERYKIQNTTPENIKHIIELGEKPIYQRDSDSRNEVATETLIFLQEFLKQNEFTEYRKSSDAYRQLSDNEIIVRREDPRKLFDLVNSQNGYEVDFQTDRYANCVSWRPQTDGSKNIYNAFMEGFTSLNGIVSVIGFSPDENGDLVAMPDSVKDFYGLDRSGVRSYKGKVSKSQLKFITLRVPAHLIPESLLTDEEIDMLEENKLKNESGGTNNPTMIFRTYIPQQQKFDS